MLIILPVNNIQNDIEHIFSKRIHPIQLCNVIYKNKGIIGIAHMFRNNYNSIGNMPIPATELEKVIDTVDFIEVSNGGASDSANKMTENWALNYNKPMTRGSDSHRIDSVVIFGTVFSVPIKNEKELIEAIKADKIINRNLILE